MPTTTPKFLSGQVLNSTLTTNLYTAPTATTTRVEHIIISNGSTPGAVTLIIYDGSSASYEILNAFPIVANGALEIANVILNAGQALRGGATTTTNAKITMFGTETV